MIKKNPFTTWYEQGKPSKNYVAHYTRLDSFWQILYYRNLRLSRLNSLNDIIEPELKIEFESKLEEKDRKSLERYLCNLVAHIYILSLSHDAVVVEKKDFESDRFFNDYTGRSFALPRMWAQYSNNNQGVCLLFDKKKLLTEAKKAKQFLFADDVKYGLNYPCFKISDNLSQGLLGYISQYKNSINTDYAADKQFLVENEDYMVCNYMTKLKDWEAEAEYRIVEWSNLEQPTISNLFDFLCGVILGEHIDPAYISLVSNNLPKKIPIYRIYFKANGIYLKRIERSD